eukprot:TRINITY_DN695_c0_g1_i23.p1 TRINITY_DN695_c0_g1~~TRINITY_DN695_c0_g1_i23.p1  ORF type:complete len:789 (-),score=161.64 TRINITY_DN695_c0_g1_i23:596-2644(-)
MSLSTQAILEEIERCFSFGDYFVGSGFTDLFVLRPSGMGDLLKPDQCSLTRDHLNQSISRVYDQLVLTYKSQSVLLTGNSGSGKTILFNLVLQHLTSRSSAGASRITETLSYAQTLLFALGNTVTGRRNINSSCFSQFLKLFVGRDGTISGAFLETFLLDKSRLISRNQGERSFHIFYQIFAGMEVDKKAALYLSKASNYTYLKTGEITFQGIDDFSGFMETKAAMEGLNFSEDEQTTLFKIIASILHLGNLTFSSVDGVTIVDNREILEDHVSVLLGVPARDLQKVLCQPVRNLAGQEFTRKLNPQQVTKARDVITCSLYDRLFRWVVDKINQTFKLFSGSKNSNSFPYFGILDIIGFSTENRFTSFCCNYLNEKVQQVYNAEVMGKRTELVVEQVPCELSFSNNRKSAIHSINSIFSKLDQHVWPKSLTPQMFAREVRDILGLIAEPESLKFKFEHYAVPVEYDVTDWLLLNDSTAMEDNMENLLAHSSDDLVVDVVDTFRPPNPLDGELYESVSREFVEQLDGLFKQILQTQRHFIRCILPDHNLTTHDHLLSSSTGNVLDIDHVSHQLEFSRVAAGLKLSFFSMPFKDFGQRYLLLTEPKAQNCTWQRSNIENFVSKLLCTFFTNQINKEDKCLTVGKTKIFLKEMGLKVLEEERKKMMDCLVPVLQVFISFPPQTST